MSLILAALIAATAAAYIPEYSTIASRTAETHGKSAYAIEQDVTYRKDNEAFTVKETWLVLNENNLRLTVEGRGALKGLVHGSVIYTGASKEFLDANRALRTQRLGEDWLESLFHFRTGRYLRQRLVNLRIAPAESLRDRAPMSADGHPQYEPQNFLRLSRVGGAITWAVGSPPTSEASPALWIEQDQFTIRKVRTPNQVTLKADDYRQQSEGLWYPQRRTYTLGAYTIEVQTLQVKSLGKLSANDPRFRSASLTNEQDPLRLPEAEGLHEFYKRMR